jgi:hypothetical protein
MMQAEMINYLPSEQTVFIQADLEYVPGKVGTDATTGGASATGKNLVPEYLGVLKLSGCSGTAGAIPAAWRPAKDTAGKVQADGFKILENGHIINLSKCLNRAAK